MSKHTVISAVMLFLGVFVLYSCTTAPATLFGDPAEYQFIPAILGIAHPPGYAFYTLLARLWQMVIPIGTIAFRTNLLAAAVGAWTVTVVYLIVAEHVSGIHGAAPHCLSSNLPPLFAALTLAAAPDFWQHAIHANAHIVSAALTTTHLWLLLRWQRTGHERWLALFCITCGWAATHHPITMIGIPAYAIFILAVQPSIMRLSEKRNRRIPMRRYKRHRDAASTVFRIGTMRWWRTLVKMIGCLLVGLLPLLYYPLRSPTAPFGPRDMHTWSGFWRHFTAQGLRVNLFHFGLADQPDRLAVFWSILGLQFPLASILLILIGLVWTLRRSRAVAVLLLVFLFTHLAFTLNTVQDVMAYLLIPFAACAVATGLGAAFVLAYPHYLKHVRTLLAVVLLALPIHQGVVDLLRGISLRDFNASEEYVAAVYKRFAGRGEGAVLLAAWEKLTPLWVHMYTEGKPLREEDVRLVYVTAARPWVESVWQYIETGPLYLADYRPSVRDAGFRLVPDGPFYRVVAPPVSAGEAVPTHPLDVMVGEGEQTLRLLGYDLLTDTVRAGEHVELILYQSVEQPFQSIWMPYARVGPLEARWTTDSRLLTTQWLPGEVVVERYEVPLPFNLPAGEYPLRLGYADLSGGRLELPLSTGDTTVELTTITVLPSRSAHLAGRERALANLDNQILLASASARAGWQKRTATWTEPLYLRRGQAFHLTLTWRAMTAPRDSYTVFIHLIDGSGRPVLGHDYTPLGGACPTYLWFPKWLPGQTFSDPYRLTVPADLPPGDYWLEVGMYGMTSLQRLPVVNLEGNLAGDRVILGPVRVN